MECQIPANSDVAGIGVRVSIYFQALFAIASAYGRFKASGATLSEDMLRSTFISSMTIIFTGLAIAVSGLIQAWTYGLSVYHALLLLDLCWVIILGALVPFFFTIVAKKIEGHADPLDYLSLQCCGLLGWGDPDPFIRFPSRLHLLHSLHFTITSCVGIWFISCLRTFDTSTDNCTQSTFAVIVGHKHLVTAPAYRTFSLALYCLFAIPILNVVLVMLILQFLPFLVNCFLFGFTEGVNGRSNVDYSDRFPKSIDGTLWAPLIAVILVICSTEQTIQANNVAPGEGQWTLGQTLALMAAFISTIDFDLWLWRKIFPRSALLDKFSEIPLSRIDDEDRPHTPSTPEIREALPDDELKAAWRAWDARGKSE